MDKVLKGEIREWLAENLEVSIERVYTYDGPAMDVELRLDGVLISTSRAYLPSDYSGY